MIGAVLDDTYRVVERLGAGGMGEVYLVEHIHLGRREAIKVLRPEMAQDPRLASRFRREARAINRLRHPNIIGIHDFGQLPDGRLYLTMEYAGGNLLDHVLRTTGRFDVTRALGILHQLAGAIDHAHSQGVTHRDLKPSNLALVEERGKTDILKILDFGLAKVKNPQGNDENLTLLGEIMGTPEYLAPERLASGPDDPRSDLYAIGCIAYELLVGKPPFTGPNPMVLAAHMQTPPQPPGRAVQGIPPLLDTVILQLLAKRPEQRLQSGAQLVSALEQVPGFPRKNKTWTTGSMSTSSMTGPTERPGQTARMKAPAAMGLADTASAKGDDVRDEIFNALVELAVMTTQQAPGDSGLDIALNKVRGVLEDRGRFQAERNDLDMRQDGAFQSAREREGNLRFAIAELRFERQRAGNAPQVIADLDYQISALENRVLELGGEAQAETRRLEERAIELAAREHDLQVRWIDLHRRLRVALSLRLLTLGPPAASIAQRFAVIGAAVDEMIALSSM